MCDSLMSFMAGAIVGVGGVLIGCAAVLWWVFMRGTEGDDQ